ncbi:uncharacterized protein LOC127001493 isoform X3 [Eriocheir sinensis]|uniref:uncharacterized protein LOC127001493 isoform X3 n=1 Tax=Eriocheir sinensis TaxID=95602 RepID=UPI0021C67680|nr:uncharacterized protein LOC127001493 isoform X3 [Eriocheir sinensis]
MTGRRAALLSPGVLRVTPRGASSQSRIRPWGGRRPVVAGVTGHCLLLQLLFHAAANAKTTSHLAPAEALRHASLGAPSSIPFFFTREEPRQEASLPALEPPAAPPRRPFLGPQAASAAAATRRYHREHLGWPAEDLSNVSLWGGMSYRGRHPTSNKGEENQQEHVGNFSSGSNRTESTVPLRARPLEWRRATPGSVRIGGSLRSGALPGTTGGSTHENRKRGLRRRWDSPGGQRGKIKANLVSSEAAWEVRSIQTAPLLPLWLPQSPSFSNKKKMESEHFCVESHLGSLSSLTPNTAGGDARPHWEAHGPQATQTPASDIELMSSEESAEDLRRLEEENSGGEEWEEEDELPLVPSQDYYKSPQGVLRRWKRKTEVQEVRVVEGGLAVLPCSLAVDDPRDSVQLILWIKEGVHTPLYSYDYRELLGGRPKETKPDANTTLARRTSFRTDTTPAALLVERVEAEDAGVYRCRVDHLLSPTTNTRTNLTVIVPPSRARVSWSLGNSGLMPVDTPTVGPFQEGAAPTLVCTNDDGWPPPAVIWYEGQKLLDDSYEADTDLPSAGAVENELTLEPLTRADLGRRLTCTASNTNTTQPATTTVTLDLTLSIVGVKVEEVKSAWAGEETEVECKVWGSRPPPSVVWWLGSTMLAPSHAKAQEEGNVTVSVLKFTPKAEDDGAMLICQATNEKLPDQAVQDSRLLSINYAPQVEVSLGRNLDPGRIKEGDDVYFECSVKAKPTISRVAWRHNGVELVAGAGVFVSNMSLVVQRVTRARGGDYTCEATNARATSSSPPLHLDVKYAPVCGRQERTQHSVAKLENAEVSCRVDANPPKVTFRWTFNNTAEAIDVPDGRFVVVGTESRVNYTPMNELDYGTLLCWANNTIGVQARPCVFHIVAAGKPDPPHNCRVFDVTISSLQVTCLPGDDGGLSQEFLLQVFEVGSITPVVEVTRPSPSFSVTNLRPATAYKVTVTAVNHKGASRATQLKAYTSRVLEMQEETSAEPARDRERGPGVPVVVGVGAGLATVPLVVAVGVLVWMKLCRRIPTPPPSPRRHSTLSKDAASTALPSEGSPHRDPDLLSHTTATISTSSSFFLHNGGTPYPSSAHHTGAAPAAGASEYTQLLCPESSHAHAHAHALGQPPVATTVPYFTDAPQAQAVEVGAAAAYPPSCSRAEIEGQATLERRRQCHHDATDPALHSAFPHLYQAASGRSCPTPHGSQYCLTQCPAPLAVSSPSHSQQGTLRRDAHKVRSGPSSHMCQMHESPSPRESYSGQVEAAHRGCRRKDVGGSEGGDQEESLTPNTARKNKRESAV